MHQVRKAVIPAAGLGTRFLPATKSLPKEMLPVVDKPAIQYVVEEAVQAGLTDILIITGRNKRAVEDHFDRNFELEHYLERDGKHDLLKEVQYRVRPRRHPLRAPARSARARPRGVGRASPRRRRAVRGAARRRPHGRRRARCCARCSTCTTKHGHVGDRAAGGAAGGDLVVRLRRSRSATPVDGLVEIRAHRREAAARGRAVEPRGHRPLRVHARDLRHARSHRAGRGRRAAAHRRDRAAARRAAGVRRDVHARPLRRRPEARLPAGQRRARARPRRPRPARSRRGCASSCDAARARRDLARRRASTASSTRSTPLAPRVVPVATTRAGSCSREDVVATEPVPPFANTGMDGYAVRAADTPARRSLRVVGELPAGTAPTIAGRAGRGDPHHDRRADARRRRRGRDGRAHACRRRRRRRRGRAARRSRAARGRRHRKPAQSVFERGHGAHARAPRRAREPRRRRGVVSSRGRASACARPATSSSSRVRSRRAASATRTGRCCSRCSTKSGCEPVDGGIVRDDEAAITDGASTRAADTCDALLTSGAVSVGDYDFVKVVLERLAEGTRRHVAVGAGRDQAGQAAGVRDARRGARVRAARQSGVVARELRAVRPARAAQARGPDRRAAEPDRHGGRRDAVRAAGPTASCTSTGCGCGSRTAATCCERAGVQASNVLSGMAAANGLALLPDGDGVDAGDEVDVLLL